MCVCLCVCVCVCMCVCVCVCMCACVCVYVLMGGVAGKVVLVCHLFFKEEIPSDTSRSERRDL